MDQRHVARMIAVARIGLGVGLTLAPGVLGRVVGVEAESRSPFRFVTRTAGVRDIAMGWGTLRALDDGADPATWVRLSALCDLGDAAAAGLGFSHLGKLKGGAAVAIAAVSGAAGMGAADNL